MFSFYLFIFLLQRFCFQFLFILILFLYLFRFLCLYTHIVPSPIIYKLYIYFGRKRVTSILTWRTVPSKCVVVTTPTTRHRFIYQAFGLEPFESTSSQHHHDIVYLVNSAKEPFGSTPFGHHDTTRSIELISRAQQLREFFYSP